MIAIRPSLDADVLEFISWRYEPPYDVYNINDDPAEAIEYFLGPGTGCHTLCEDDVVVGFFTLGSDGQVPGGDYRQDAIDIGMGVRPDRTGAGEGIRYVKSVVDHVVAAFDPSVLRVTIAAPNIRAQRVWAKAGFCEVSQFDADRSVLGSTEFRVFTFAPDATQKR